MENNNVTFFNHPLVQHKISLLRNENTGTKDFRILVEEISTLMGYEALKDLPTELVNIKTPIAEAQVPMLSGKKPAIVPILRAGIGMVNGLLSLVPSAKVGHIGVYRDDKTHEPHEYYANLPENIEERMTIVADPMLATGGTSVTAIKYLKEHGAKNIKFMCIIAAPEGLKALQEAHPDIEIYVGCLDQALNENAYIVPGLGDAGDRIFGTN